VVDALIVAVLNGTQDLKEHLAGLCIILNIVAFLGDLGEQVTFRAVLENNKGRIPAVDNLVHGHNAIVLAGKVVKLDLTLLKLPLSGIKSSLVQGLDGV